MLAHLRTEAYPVYREPRYPPALEDGGAPGTLSYERNVTLIEEAKRRARRR
jgi:hypothetical protein